MNTSIAFYGGNNTIRHLINSTMRYAMADSKTVTKLQKLIKQFQQDALAETLKLHAEPLTKIHQIMHESGLTPDMIALTYKSRKPRGRKTQAVPSENKIPSAPKAAPVASK